MTARHVRPRRARRRAHRRRHGRRGDGPRRGCPLDGAPGGQMARRGGGSPRDVMATLHDKCLLKMIALENCRPARRSRRGDSRIALPSVVDDVERTLYSWLTPSLSGLAFTLSAKLAPMMSRSYENEEPMTLFDDIERRGLADASPSISSFQGLDQDDGPGATRKRDRFESWFKKFPPAGQKDLRVRFRSDDDHVHEGAFFELFLHELLNRLGFSVSVHPKIPWFR